MLPKRLDNPLEYRKHIHDRVHLPPKGQYPHYHQQQVWVGLINGAPTYATWDGPVDMKALISKVQEELDYATLQKNRLEKWLKLVKA